MVYRRWCGAARGDAVEADGEASEEVVDAVEAAAAAAMLPSPAATELALDLCAAIGVLAGLRLGLVPPDVVAAVTTGTGAGDTATVDPVVEMRW